MNRHIQYPVPSLEREVRPPRIPDLNPGDVLHTFHPMVTLPDVTIRWHGDRDYELINRDARFYDAVHGRSWVIPEGFRFDAASVPRAAWSFASPTCLGVLSVLTHDYLYANGGQVGVWRYTREEADILFRRLMKLESVPRLRRNAAYKAVKLFGEGAWKAR